MSPASTTPRSPQFQWDGNFVPLDQVEPTKYDGIIMVRAQQQRADRTDERPPKRTDRLAGSLMKWRKPGSRFLHSVPEFGRSHASATFAGNVLRVASIRHPTSKLKAVRLGLENEKLVVDGDLITCSNEEDATPLLDALLERILG